MKVFTEPDEAAERLEELISLTQHNDEVIICREGVPIAVLTALQEDFDRSRDRLRALMTEERSAISDQTSNHHEFYDENGLPQ